MGPLNPTKLTLFEVNLWEVAVSFWPRLIGPDFRNYEILQQQDKQVFSVQPMQSFQVLATTAGAAPAYNDPYLNLQTAFNALRIADL